MEKASWPGQTGENLCEDDWVERVFQWAAEWACALMVHDTELLLMAYTGRSGAVETTPG